MNEMFKVDTLDEITYKLFEMAVVACMSEDTELQGLLGVACGSDFVLYEGRGEAVVKVRNWSNMPELLITARTGHWLVYSHVNGMGVKATTKELYRQFTVCKPYINTDVDYSFKPQDITPGKASRWLAECETVMQNIRKYVKEESRNV